MTESQLTPALLRSLPLSAARGKEGWESFYFFLPSLQML